MQGNKGLISLKELKTMSTSTGLPLDKLVPVLPFGVRHLASKKQMKVLKVRNDDNVAPRGL